MKQIKEAFDSKNYEKLKQVAHSMKGAAAYVGAGRLHYVCYYMQENWASKNYLRMLDFYPSLVEAVIETKIELAKLIAEREK